MMFKRSKLIPFEVSNVLYENRYCDQEGSSILVCGGKDKKEKITNEVLKLEIPSFKVNKFPSMVGPHYYLDLVNIKSDILAICYSQDKNNNVDLFSVCAKIYSEKQKLKPILKLFFKN